MPYSKYYGGKGRKGPEGDEAPLRPQAGQACLLRDPQQEESRVKGKYAKNRARVRYTPSVIDKDRFAGPIPKNQPLRAFVKKHGRLPHDQLAFQHRQAKAKRRRRAYQ